MHLEPTNIITQLYDINKVEEDNLSIATNTINKRVIYTKVIKSRRIIWTNKKVKLIYSEKNDWLKITIWEIMGIKN